MVVGYYAYMIILDGKYSNQKKSYEKTMDRSEEWRKNRVDRFQANDRLTIKIIVFINVCCFLLPNITKIVFSLPLYFNTSSPLLFQSTLY